MKYKPFFSSLLFLTPLLAQVPHFTDGVAFGGSKVFAEGINPLANPASATTARQGLYVGWAEGDQRMAENQAALKALSSGLQPNALSGLRDNPWGERIRTYGLAWAESGRSSAYTHEEHTALWANTDMNVADNRSTLDVRRAQVDRISVLWSERKGDLLGGVGLRVERWRFGGAQYTLGDLAARPGWDPLTFRDTSKATFAVALDGGYTQELLPGVRMGVTVDRLLAKRFYDGLEEKPQFRLGFQMDMGAMARLSVESDINAAMRAPFPIKQRTANVSLQIVPSPYVSLVVGGLCRDLEGKRLYTGGVTLWVNVGSYRLGGGFQYSKDRPMKSFTGAVL